MFQGYYRRRRVLVTGHTGFKGGWLSLWLRDLGASVIGLALPAEESPNLYEVIQPGTFEDEFWADVKDPSAVERAIRKARPDFVFHLAAQSLVRRSFLDPVETVQTNVIGSMNLLEALRRSRSKANLVAVTSDKCYANTRDDKDKQGYREHDPLGGRDPYSMSKAASELLIDTWRRSFFEQDEKLGNIATARGGNVIGGGDYADSRIIPDCVKFLEQGEPVRVRHPRATRPWHHVLDCLSGYLWLGAKLGSSGKNSSYATAYNFGPPPSRNKPVRAVVEEFLKYWPGKWVDIADTNGCPEATQLALSIRKADDELDWKPTWGFSEAIKHTAAWYRRRKMRGEIGLRKFSLNQIASFSRAAHKQKQPWALPGSEHL
jgi:CDP-glucose 4,6-dehydratase